MIDSNGSTAAPRQQRRFLRFTLRSLLVVVAAFAVLLAAHVHRMRSAQRQHDIVAKLRSLGVYPQYDYVQDENWDSGEKSYPQWLEDWVGEDYLYGVDAILIASHQYPDDLIELTADLHSLRLIKLPACKISDDSLRPLQELPRLEWLELFLAPVTDECMETIVKLDTLEILDLRGTKVTDQSIPAILSLPNLTRLNIGNTAITPAGVEQLRSGLPNCRVDTET